ncbi:hypothetical protein LX36DRAFT_340736 [Colletotrichum falcatum]|nr:hypothetical protein LX36DRAFT_340736 [Colletotrichum falcatum]
MQLEGGDCSAHTTRRGLKPSRGGWRISPDDTATADHQPGDSSSPPSGTSPPFGRRSRATKSLPTFTANNNQGRPRDSAMATQRTPRRAGVGSRQNCQDPFLPARARTRLVWAVLSRFFSTLARRSAGQGQPTEGETKGRCLGSPSPFVDDFGGVIIALRHRRNRSTV